MRMTTRSGLGLVAGSAMVLLCSGMAGAQDADLQAQVEDVLRRYEEAIAAGDWQAVASLYAEDGIYAPLMGGLIEGREGIAGFYAESGVKGVDLRPSRAEMIGEDGVLLLGTFTVTLAGEAGDMDIEGEYVTIGEVGEDGIRIRSVNVFPMRQAPPAQE